MKKYIFLLFLFFVLCKLKNEEKQKESLSIYVLQNLFLSQCNLNLSDQPTFKELQQKKVFANCVSCHSATNSLGNLNLENYEQTKGITVPFKPEESKLYLVVLPGGNMEKYSNTCINYAIYQWIKQGSKE